MKALLNELMALLPPTIGPEAERAMIFIADMTKDDERFAECQTFDDYVHKAAEITAPPEPPSAADADAYTNMSAIRTSSATGSIAPRGSRQQESGSMNLRKASALPEDRADRMAGSG